MLFRILESLEMKYLFKDVVWLSILQLLIDILQSMVGDQDFINKINETNKVIDKGFLNDSIEKILKVCTNILLVVSKDVKLDRDLKKCLLSPEDFESLSKNKTENIIQQYEKLETNLFRSLFICLKNCLLRKPNEITSFFK